MKKLNIYLTITLAIFILLSPINYASDGTTSNIIYIKSTEDLISLSENCTLDIYSQNKIVELTNDLDLSNIDFKIIPSFSGIFNGNNHTISGFNSYNSGSNQGLFRYLQEEGVIKNLHVKGNVKPIGTKKEIGGIIGTNKGQILNCSFNGEIRGKTNIGGIVGYNDKTGSIINCTSTGFVIGEHYTGGIVGQNVGYIENCINNCSVNTTNDAIPNNDMASYNFDNIDVTNLNSTENIDAQTDTGGIVGYNQGIIKSSKNNGSIGYAHVGYNIGGIVGRQSGYISDCKNYGIVNGRKDVGGVTGQAEPFIRLLFSEDTLERIDNEIIVLNNLTEKLINDGDQSSEIISSRLERLNTLTASASDKMQDLMNNTTNYVDDSTSTVNTGIDRVRYVMSELETVLESFVIASNYLTCGLGDLEKGFKELSSSSVPIHNSINDLVNACDDLGDASDSLTKAFDKFSKAMQKLEKAADSSDEFDKALEDLLAALEELDSAIKAMIKAFEKFADVLERLDDPLNADWITLSQDLRKELKNMSDHFDTAFSKINPSLSIFIEEFKNDQTLIKESFDLMGIAMEDLKNFSDSISDATQHIQYALGELNSASSIVSDAMNDMSKGMDYFKSASDECSTGLNRIRLIIKELNKLEELQLPKLNDYITESSDSLFEEIRNISNELILLNEESKNVSDTFYNNLRGVNSQFKVIMDIIREGLDALSFNNTDLFEDISDENLQEEPTLEKGIIRDCYNNATVFGDVNVGGIAGLMAIEFDFDPEDDIINKGKQTFNFKYQTKGLLMSSINNGKIQAKKDYAGGIVGKMDLGLIITSENYGSVENLDGDYTGGIVGSSNSVIRKCYSLTELSGRNYVGGIAGYGTNIYDCIALITVDMSNEFTGAIAGDISGEFENNYFVKEKYDGVDGISYGNKAMPQSYESFILNKDLPEAFKSFQLTFVVDDNIIKTIPFEYANSLDSDILPDIPEKEGYYGTWPPYDYNRLVFSRKLEAIYTPMIQVLSSNPDTPHSKLLVEGSFEPDDTLNINTFNSSNMTINNYPKIEEWSIQLNTSVDKPLTYRFLRPQSNKEILLYQKVNNKWLQLKTIVDGSYLLFESDLQSFNLAVVEKNNIKIAYYILGALVIALILLLILNKKRSKKLNKSKNIVNIDSNV